MYWKLERESRDRKKWWGTLAFQDLGSLPAPHGMLHTQLLIFYLTLHCIKKEKKRKGKNRAQEWSLDGFFSLIIYIKIVNVVPELNL